MTCSDPIGYWIEGDDARPVYGHDAAGLTATSLVLLGDTIAEMREWGEALGLGYERLRGRLRNGDTALRALRPRGVHGHDPTDAEVAAFIAEHGSQATLAEIGEVLGVTRERVRQIEAEALRKLRRTWSEDEAREWLRDIDQRTDTWSEIEEQGWGWEAA